MFALNLGDNGRVLSACPAEYAARGQTIVAALPDGDLPDRRYVAGEYILDPLPDAPAAEESPSRLDRVEAQALYTALMMGTLIGGEDDV